MMRSGFEDDDDFFGGGFGHPSFGSGGFTSF